MKRFGQRLGLRADRQVEYERHHAKIWPEITTAIERAGIRNYSIFHYRGELFAYYEYHGPDDEFEARMDELAAAPRMREWWDLMEPMQNPDPDRSTGAWWTDMKEVFHQD